MTVARKINVMIHQRRPRSLKPLIGRAWSGARIFSISESGRMPGNPSAHVHAAVDLDGLTDEEGGIFAGQKGDHLGHLLRLAGATERNRLGDAFESFAC